MSFVLTIEENVRG